MTTMTQEINEYIEKFKANKPKEVQVKMQHAIEELEASNEGKGLRTGEQAPNFNLPNAAGETVELYEQLKKGPVVLTFYRGNWCPYCNMELRAYQQIIGEIHDQGAELIAISPQTPDQSMSIQEKHDLEYLVVSDEGNTVANQFNLVYQLPEYLVELYKAIGLDVAKHNGDDTWTLPVSATYIIQTDGTIAYEYTKSDYKDRVEPSDVLQELKKIN
ncbi:MULTISPECIES: peroxiredoxin-like family protein [Planococcus]|uniref:thioredoxin-dependent peroxiredoxin n=1 Tax=Planococcus faecalis TaxID=1598147 RepID=A0ABN4XL69_9BACL|nr:MULTISPECIES: peroxiredoxin-like family protein [Planococcus]AQU79485.1 alkyl hydroperoxide reductase [Planococcus faecalis]MDJ0332565.1 peroxiredoxin-like family protein [Planococcus sp. S3-L1]OHX51450.1 alkyl hydroperoxide reductase [Planococcus faecalis]